MKKASVWIEVKMTIELRVYDEVGQLMSKASLYDVCEWWIQTYPADIFVNEPKQVVEIRLQMQKILAKRDRG